MKTKSSCATCGVEIKRKLSSVKKCKHGSMFCSRDCHYKGRSLGLTKRIVTQPYVFSLEGKAALIAAASQPKGKRRFHPMKCLECGKLFDDPNYGRTRKSGMTFCSLVCCNLHRKGDKNPAWRGGYPNYYGADWRAARRAARIRDDYKCRRCGKKTVRNPDVHHIVSVGSFVDPNDANTLENLVCLCHSCHMRIEWHGMDFSV